MLWRSYLQPITSQSVQAKLWYLLSSPLHLLRRNGRRMMWPHHESQSNQRKNDSEHGYWTRKTLSRPSISTRAGRSSTDLFGKRPAVEVARIPREQTLDRLKPPVFRGALWATDPPPLLSTSLASLGRDALVLTDLRPRRVALLRL